MKPLGKVFNVSDILVGAKKIIKNLAIEIRHPGDGMSFRFFKVRIGKKGDGRMIAFFTTANGNVVPLLIRAKKDKQYGENMSSSNKFVTQQIKKNLLRVLEDIRDNRFEKFDIPS